MKVLGTKLLLKVEKSGKCSQKIGGLTIPVGNEEYETAEVLEIGTEVEEEGKVSKGDKVLIYPGTGKNFFYGGGEYRVITSNEIIVVL